MSLARLLALASLLALAALPAAPGAGAATVCLADRPLLYCATAASDLEISCSANATHYSCSVEAAYGAAGSTRSALGGNLLPEATLTVSVCNGPGDCVDTQHDLGASACTWARGGHACADAGTLTLSLGDELAGGCLYVNAALSVHAAVQAETVARTVATATDHDILDFLSGSC